MRNLFIFLLLLQLFSQSAFSWGKWGHAIVGSNAALVLSEEEGGAFFKIHSYDLGYYNNVPDFIWKGMKNIYPIEKKEHFMDLEHFTKGMKTKNWSSNRLQFEKENPKVKPDDGRAYWRVKELSDRLEKLQKELQKKRAEKPHQETQGKWLVTAGVLGHYIADLAMPLHCSENYDGVLTKQKGIHAHFEERLIDEIATELANDVLKVAREKWSGFHKSNKEKTVFELAKELCENSNKTVSPLLLIDKRVGRKDMKKAVQSFQTLAKERLVLGTLYLAEIWSRYLGWEYKGNRFFFFDARPDYIYPVGAKK